VLIAVRPEHRQSPLWTDRCFRIAPFQSTVDFRSIGDPLLVQSFEVGEPYEVPDNRFASGILVRVVFGFPELECSRIRRLVSRGAQYFDLPIVEGPTLAQPPDAALNDQFCNVPLHRLRRTNQLRHSRPLASDMATEALNGCCLERLVRPPDLCVEKVMLKYSGGAY